MSILSLDTARESRAARVEPTRIFAEAYNAFTVTTAKYPTDTVQLAGNVSAGMLYTGIGLANEVGELAELFDQEAIKEEFRVERYQKAWHELGDVQWYAARLCAETPELPRFDVLVQEGMQRLADAEYREVRISGYDLQSALCAHAGRVLGVIKKMMRDGATWSGEKRAEKIAELRGALASVIAVSVEYAERTGPLVGCEGGYEKLLFDNREKLNGRRERGTLQGDGDVR
ncbi:hypothetical protein Seregon_BL70045 [Xanthomonas phage Seregon]|nr:hypothetical protein Seregon_BL70045 [Xanthomonas phage Seregon]